MTLFHWSRTAATNGTADITCPFPEGMGAPALNDGARGMMAAVAKYRDDMAGAIVTGGTAGAYTVLSYQGFDSLADMNGQEIAFSPHATNVDTVLLNVDGLGSKPLRSAPGVELLSGTLVLGSPYVALYNNTDGVFYLKGYFMSPYNVPFLGGMDFWDTIAPNSTFIFPMGQAISRTFYARAFARWGTKFGVGDGSTTFNVPDKTGRVSAMTEAVATRLPAASFAGDSTQIGAVGGGPNHMMAASEIASHSTSGVNAISVASNDTTIATGGISDNYSSIAGAGTWNSQVRKQVTSTGNNAIVTSYTNGAQVASPIVQATITCNYIIRVF